MWRPPGTWFQAISGADDGSGLQQSGGGGPTQGLGDADLLDAYSQAVIRVVEQVSPAVISLFAGGNRSSASRGSGFLISPDGLAISNSHVVSGHRRLTAATADGDRVDADVVGMDPSTDVALIRIAARDLPYATIGDSTHLRVGQLVIAMGSPLGLHATVSTGIVSALGRSMRGQDGRLIESVVQHTAPINPGNSGGPLVDSRGHVVGVNTAMMMMAQGLGFAVPSKTVQWVAGELMAHGRVERRQLGIVATSRRLSRSEIRAHDLVSDQAVEVIDVTPGSEADRAGIFPGDMLLAINDRILTSVDDVHRILAALPRHAELNLSILRQNRLLDLLLPGR